MNPSSNEPASLFLLCPASQLEPFIRQHVGQHTYFLTALASVFDVDNVPYAEALVDFLETNAIRELYVVQDLNCRFLRTVLSGVPGTGTAAERVLQALYCTHFEYVMRTGTFRIQCYRLARLHVLQQAEQLLANGLLQRAIGRNRIALRAMICDKSTRLVETIDLKPEGICL
ncbi:hypothetical protein [Cesiribacter andamanensis]|uniref:Uncharacterized protein n=1 Tax=Cesiribacter andamanensis AMV16 TaxID=1279009 RepID=M7N3J0_9BACT|nr:hypothetical protein [Cesiribacter andamanensis]EMR01761.1 hypothetical protein ADICEAN_03120 [Cesiribacter andamanensis AMV16]